MPRLCWSACVPPAGPHHKRSLAHMVMEWRAGADPGAGWRAARVLSSAAGERRQCLPSPRAAHFSRYTDAGRCRSDERMTACPSVSQRSVMLTGCCRLCGMLVCRSASNAQQCTSASRRFGPTGLPHLWHTDPVQTARQAVRWRQSAPGLHQSAEQTCRRDSHTCSSHTCSSHPAAVRHPATVLLHIIDSHSAFLHGDGRFLSADERIMARLRYVAGEGVADDTRNAWTQINDARLALAGIRRR
jgi:hypothetical protein